MKESNLNGFLFASLDEKFLPKLDLLLKERICFKGAKFFQPVLIPIEKGSNNKASRV